MPANVSLGSDPNDTFAGTTVFLHMRRAAVGEHRHGPTPLDWMILNLVIRRKWLDAPVLVMLNAWQTYVLVSRRGLMK